MSRLARRPPAGAPVAVVLAAALAFVALALTFAAGSTAPVGASPASSVRALLVEPTAGLAKIYASIAGAKKSIDLEMYELVDPEAEHLLAQAAARGVDVRVVLDHRLEGSRNATAYAYLTSHHVSVVWAPSFVYADHEKAMVVDTDEAWIMTLNLTSAYYADTRDFALLDTNLADVHAIAATFDADFSHVRSVPSPGADLVWSPTNSSSVLLSMISGARSSLWVESEELTDSTVVDALVAAAHRGVAVHVIMNDTREYADAFDAIVEAGGKVGTYSGAGLYIHAKVVVADAGTPDAEAFLGSENFTATSLHDNRELGITTRDTTIVHGLATVLEHDFMGSTAWVAPATHAASAWCTAAAAPADDGYSGDYKVSIHSNQPDSEATASDASDTYSRETSSTGYVSITLWHQHSGEIVTVTVGSARCSTAV